MYVPAGQPFTATMVAPSGLSGRFGARIEVPVTRAIVGYWVEATLSGFVYSVQQIAPPTQSLRPPELGTDPALDNALRAGVFNLVWMDDGPVPAVEIFVPLFVYPGESLPGMPPDWPVPDLDALMPSVDEVSILVRTRTYTEGVEEHPVFTDDTRPNIDDVDRLLAQAGPAILSQLRPAFPESYYDDVGHMIALYTAVLIEGSFFREQLAESQVALYQDLITTGLLGINTSIDAELAQVNAGALRLV